MTDASASFLHEDKAGGDDKTPDKATKALGTTASRDIPPVHSSA